MRLIKISRGIVCACLTAAALLVLQGCRDSEQGRIVLYEKGKYLGKADKALTAAQIEALRFRAKTIQGN